jgi:YhcH/YjgK/YiaL family protein
MIVDNIENAYLYTGLSDGLKKAFEILADRTLSSKEDGRYDVDGDKLYYIIQHYTTKPIERDKLEAHRKYIDIQVVISGGELLAYASIEGLAVAQPYSEDKDIAFYHAPDKVSMVTLRPGVFCILFPQDGHIPCCQLNGPSDVHKVVIKVKID